jgi:hypothetical protein
VYGVVSVAAGRRWRDLGWVVGAAALQLAGVATANLLSGRSLSIALAIEAVVLAGLAWRLGAPRFELGALAYLALGVAHVAAVELEGAVELGDVPREGAAGLFSVAGAALAIALLLPETRADRPATGLARALEPLWDWLVRDRPWIRALLAALALALASAGSAALLSGRTLTLAWSAAAAAAGLAAFRAGERRLLAAALPLLGLAVLHALAVEAPPTTLALERGLDPLAPIPSLVALGAAGVVLALICRFDHRGLAFLGPLAGPERPLAEFGAARAGVLRGALLHVAAGYAVWAAGLALVEVSYDWGQVGATLLWAVLGTVFVARSTAAGSAAVVAGWGVVAFAYLKAVSFDWDQLGATPAAISVLGVSTALLAAGFLGRWLEARGAEALELLSLAVAALATVSAGVALDRLVDGDNRAFGASLLAVTAVLVGAAAPPFVRWRRRGAPTWARELATGYWVLALATLLLAEAALTDYGETRFLAAWAATATALALVWRPLQEPWLWIAALCVASVSTAGSIALVTPPERLVEATARPGAGLSALVVCVVAAATLAWRAPPFAAEWRAWLVGGAAAAGVYTMSLAVLDVAERVSGASIATDFQRGHTALSTLLGLGALGLYVVGLARDRRPLRIAGLTLFGLALAKLFLYDLRNLSSITRALSFLALGSVLLAAAFFAERYVRGERGGAGPRTV